MCIDQSKVKKQDNDPRKVFILRTREKLYLCAK